MGGPGWVETTGRYTPIAALSQEGNALLRLGLVDEVPSAVTLAQQLASLVPGRRDWGRLEPDPPLLDENVQFTVYRPREIAPVQWYKMLIFTHLDERPEWLDANEPSPMEQVEDEAERMLGPRHQSYRKTTDESRLAIPREGEITFVPKIPGIECNPPTRSFLWKDGLSVHLETFELRAVQVSDVPGIARGRVTVFLGHLILAEVAISIRIGKPRGQGAIAREASESSSVRQFSGADSIMSSVRLIDDQITALRARPLAAVFPKLTHSLKLDTRGSRNMAPSAPRVFISYSHDSLEHARRVMGLAERLRKDGVDAQLDQYVAGTPARGWPRWMEDQLDSSEFVLVICTETYRQRFLGREEPDKGKGADWEGSLITSELYHTRSDTNKFVPVLFDRQDEPFIPRPLSGHTHYLLSSEDNYAKLYAFLPAKPASCPVSLARLRRGRAKLSSR